MRLVLIGLATAIAIVAIDVPASDAQVLRRYCTFGGGDNSSGEPDCSYTTFEQCRASASGLSRYCGENPEYLWRQRGQGQQEPTTKSKGKRQRD